MKARSVAVDTERGTHHRMTGISSCSVEAVMTQTSQSALPKTTHKGMGSSDRYSTKGTRKASQEKSTLFVAHAFVRRARWTLQTSSEANLLEIM